MSSTLKLSLQASELCTATFTVLHVYTAKLPRNPHVLDYLLTVDPHHVKHLRFQDAATIYHKHVAGLAKVDKG